MSIRHSFFGKQYALFTKEGMEAAGKKAGLRDKVVLFWNTYNSRDYSEAIATIDYRQLPRSFYPYFEEEVQSIDRECNTPCQF